MGSPIDRRDFLIGAALVGASAACSDEPTSPPPAVAGLPPAPGPEPGPAIGAPAGPSPASPTAPLPTRPFGKTGVNVTILGLGGGHGVADTREFGLQIVELAYARGIRFFDAAPIYNHCQSNYGEVFEKKRGEVFLQTKTMARDRDGALRELETSLKAMRTDHLDSWMLHDIRHDAEVDQILAPGGAMEAFTKAVDEKMVRFIGASCHSYPMTLKRLLELHSLDCAIMSLNAAEAYDKPFAPTVLPVAVAQNIGIVAMKTVGYGHLLKAISAKEALGWALSKPISVAIVGVHHLEDVHENVAIARAFQPLSALELASIEERAKAVAHDATFFRRDQWAT